MSKQKALSISFIVLIILLAYLTIRQSFTLALGGDDWGIHYLIWTIFDIYKQASYFNPLTYFCTYCPHYFFLSIISRVLGYEAIYYFVASYLARVIVAFTLYFLMKKLTKRTLPAVLSSIFFAVTYLGIEATDWAFNYNHILGIAVTAVFLIWYFKTKRIFNPKNLTISALLFAAAAIVSPPRMHGLLPLLVIIELGWWLIEGRKFNLKQAGLRLLIMSIANYMVLYGVSDLYFLIRDQLFHFEIGPVFIGNGYAAHGWNEGRVRDGIALMTTWFSQGRTDFIIDPIATLGNYIIPDMLWYRIPLTQTPILLNPIIYIYGIFTYLTLKLNGLKNKIAPVYLIILTIWLFIIYLLQQANTNTFLYPRTAFSVIGGFTIIFTLWLFFLLKKEKPLFAHILLIGLGWMTTFILFPWLIGPYGVIFAWGRYSVQQGAGLAIWAAIVFTIIIDNLKQQRKSSILGMIYVVIALFTFMHLYFANNYLAHVNTYRSKQLDAKYWGKITTEIPSLDKNGLNIFLLLTDQPSAEIAEALRFGFNARSAIYYKVTRKENDPFMVVNEYGNILSSVYDGKYLAKQGHQPIPTTVNRIYALILQNKEMINITPQIREKLEEDLAALKQGNQPPPQITP